MPAARVVSVNVSGGGVPKPPVPEGGETGAAVRLQITSFAAPCRTIQASFADRRYGRISQKAHPGWSRVYARVLAPGVVRTGDPVRLARPPA